MTILHKFVSGVSDGGDASLVRPSNWNENHVLPLDNNTLHATYGDDFTGSSLDTGKWSRRNITSGDEVNQDGGGTYLTANIPGSVVSQAYFQTAPAGDFELQMSYILYSAASHMYGPMIISSTGTGVGVSPYDNSNVVFMATLSSYEYSSSNGNDPLQTLAYQRGMKIWVAIKKAGTTYTFRWSRNGDIWTPYITGTTNGFTVDRIGWGRYFGSSSGHKMSVDRFNVV